MMNTLSRKFSLSDQKCSRYHSDAFALSYSKLPDGANDYPDTGQTIMVFAVTSSHTGLLNNKSDHSLVYSSVAVHNCIFMQLRPVASLLMTVGGGVIFLGFFFRI